MSTTMKALMKSTPGPGAHLTTAPIPECKPDQVLVKVEVCSVCGTDLHIYNWDKWSASRIKPPIIFGHEFAGRVIEVGDQVKSISTGDLVSTETHIACQYCLLCKTGNMHICQNTKIIGVDKHGSFAEYVAVPEINAWVNPDGVTPVQASVQEPLGNAVHTVLSGPIVACSVAVLGCGPIGLMAIAVAKASGAKNVFASDPSPYRRQLAEKMGADGTWDPTTDPIDDLAKEVTDGTGFDAVLEMSGHEAAVRQSLRIARFGGRIALLGLPPEPVTLDLSEDVVFKGLTLQGITGRRMFTDWYQMAGLLASGKLNIDPVITHHMPMSDYERAFELMQSGQCGKIVLDPTK